MIDSKKTIIQLDKETIILDELSIIDEIGSFDKNQIEKTGAREETSIGFGAPLIIINSYMVRNIEFFRLDLTERIPQLIFRFTPENESFLYTSYPKDGDVVGLYIRATSELYKPIRMDMLVTEVFSHFSNSPIPEDKANSVGTSFTIKSQMRIPTLFQHISKSYINKTSFETLREIAKDLG